MIVTWTELAAEQYFELLGLGSFYSAVAQRIEDMVDTLAEFPDLGKAFPRDPYLRQFLVEDVRVVYARFPNQCEVVAVLRRGQKLGL